MRGFRILRYGAFVLVGILPSLIEACGWHIDPGVGGGFAGLRVPVVTPEPSYDCAAGTGVCTPSKDVVRMTGDYQYVWRPAVTTSALLRKSTSTSWGIGINLVAAPISDKATRLAPGLTGHLIDGKSQIFGGLIFMPTDAYSLPGGGLLVPAGTDPNSFIRSGVTTKTNFIIGISVSAQ